MSINNFSGRVLCWFKSHGRKDLPWQENPTPYRVWISEIMLQQTRVAAVIPYYQRFTKELPDISALAAAELDQVLHLWSGLGYYARARNLHAAAGQLKEQHGGVFPNDFEQVIALPGIGRSTAGAILALSQGQRHAILDGNVKRVLARVHGVEGWPGKTEVANQLWRLAERYTPNERLAEYTQAMMDLGATVCSRSQPQCPACPLVDDCKAHVMGRETEFPYPKPRRTIPVRDTTMVLACNDHGEVLLEHRPPTGIWGGLWSFPELEAPDQLTLWCRKSVGNDVGKKEMWPVVRHTFSHFHLDITPIFVTVGNVPAAVSDSDRFVWYKLSDPEPMGLAAPVQRLLDRLQEQLN